MITTSSNNGGGNVVISASSNKEDDDDDEGLVQKSVQLSSEAASKGCSSSSNNKPKKKKKKKWHSPFARRKKTVTSNYNLVLNSTGRDRNEQARLSFADLGVSVVSREEGQYHSLDLLEAHRLQKLDEQEQQRYEQEQLKRYRAERRRASKSSQQAASSSSTSRRNRRGVLSLSPLRGRQQSPSHLDHPESPGGNRRRPRRRMRASGVASADEGNHHSDSSGCSSNPSFHEDCLELLSLASTSPASPRGTTSPSATKKLQSTSAAPSLLPSIPNLLQARSSGGSEDFSSNDDRLLLPSPNQHQQQQQRKMAACEKVHDHPATLEDDSSESGKVAKEDSPRPGPKKPDLYQQHSDESTLVPSPATSEVVVVDGDDDDDDDDAVLEQTASLDLLTGGDDDDKYEDEVEDSLSHLLPLDLLNESMSGLNIPSDMMQAALSSSSLHSSSTSLLFSPPYGKMSCEASMTTASMTNSSSSTIPSFLFSPSLNNESSSASSDLVSPAGKDSLRRRSWHPRSITSSLRRLNPSSSSGGRTSRARTSGTTSGICSSFGSTAGAKKISEFYEEGGDQSDSNTSDAGGRSSFTALQSIEAWCLQGRLRALQEIQAALAEQETTVSEMDTLIARTTEFVKARLGEEKESNSRTIGVVLCMKQIWNYQTQRQHAHDACRRLGRLSRRVAASRDEDDPVMLQYKRRLRRILLRASSTTKRSSSSRRRNNNKHSSSCCSEDDDDDSSSCSATSSNKLFRAKMTSIKRLANIQDHERIVELAAQHVARLEQQEVAADT